MKIPFVAFLRIESIHFFIPKMNFSNWFILNLNFLLNLSFLMLGVLKF